MEQHLASYFKTGEFKHVLSSISFCKDLKLYDLGVFTCQEFLKLYPKNFFLKYELAMFYVQLSRYEEASKKLNELLSERNLPEQLTKILLKERKGILSKLTPPSNYNSQIIASIKPREPKYLTFTITSCKRFSLFERTMNSFLNCCEDLHLIDHWICVDDNSSEEDINRMKQLYPFFEFILKDKKDKGHPRSMNIILSKVKTPFLFHIEDDWEFSERQPYISNCLEVLVENPKYGQCLLNKNYSETFKDDIVGGIFKNTETGLRYYIHEFCPSEEERLNFAKKHGPNKFNVSYWPHFSFRPSIFRTNVFNTVGQFDEKVSHFEMDYARKYVTSGFLSVFLEGFYCSHIGRLTSERDDSSKLNAYILNEEKQFFGKEEDNKENKDTQVILKTYVVNLDKRKDRWEKFLQQKETEFLKYNRFPAIDGNNLTPNEALQSIFDGNDFNMRKGMVGCAMSHIALYTLLVNSPNNESIMCVLEDDVTFVPSFQEKFLNLVSQLSTNQNFKDWDMCYLGHHVWPQYVTDKTYNKTDLPTVEKWTAEQSLEKSIGGTGGYLITKNGARKLLDFINKFGMRNGIDTIQQKAANTLNIYYCIPHLIYSECWTHNNKADSDIQKDFSSLTIPLHHRLLKEKDFYLTLEKKEKLKTETVFDFKEAEKIVKDSSLEKVIFFISTTEPEPNNPRTIEYKKGEVELLMEECIHPCYTLGYRVLIIVPKTLLSLSELQSKSFDRVKRNGKYDVSEALGLRVEEVKTTSNIEEVKTTSNIEEIKNTCVVPIGDNTHISEAVSSFFDLEDLPFNKMEGLTLEKSLSLLQITLDMTDNQLKMFSQDFCSPENNEKYLQSFNNKVVVNNKRLGISFPHDNADTIVADYFQRFLNLKTKLTTCQNIYLVYGTRFVENKTTVFQLLTSLIKKNNVGCNIKILSINGFAELPEVQYKIVQFPEQFKNSEWTSEKIMYDQQKYRIEVQEPIKEFLLQNRAY